MKRSIIVYILGKVALIEGCLMLLPCLIALIYRENQGFIFLGTAAFAIALGWIMSHKKPENPYFYLKEGCIATALSWLIMSAIGAVPVFLTGEIPHYIDALFEIVSGFTTTGASILPRVEDLSHCSLFWRSLTHWIGGMGVLVFLLAIVPLSGGSSLNLMRAESPGPSVGKFVPKIRHTALILYEIYLALTIIEVIFLLIGRMPLFDTVCTAMGTAGTGGFGIRSDSFTSYSTYQQWVVTIFMILFGVNFNFYYMILLRAFRSALSMEEIRAYIGIIISAVVLIGLDIFHKCSSVFDALTQAAFQVASIITTTGFSSADFDQWPTFSKAILVLLMFCGACAGSTGGGLKVSRIIIAIKTIASEISSYVHPKSVKVLKMDNKPLEPETTRSTLIYFMTFFSIFIVSVLLVSLGGDDLITNFTAVAATINNIGPGLAMVGPTQNFAFYSYFAKCVLILDMLFGRLELYPLIILFSPSVWFEMVTGKTKGKKKRP